MSENLTNELDVIRVNQGHKKLTSHYQQLLQDDPDHAVSLINDSALTFPSLFLLTDLLQEQTSSNDLSLRNQISIQHINNVLKEDDKGVIDDRHFSEQHHQATDTFKWMITTGAQSLINPSYTHVIDSASILILLNYREDLKKEIVDLIFYRHRHQTHNHYLIWAFFEVSEPKDLMYICTYLYSSNLQNQKLARKLLDFIPGLKKVEDPLAAYHYGCAWIERNLPYLISSGETNDMMPGPKPFELSYAGKYLGMMAQTRTGNAIVDLTTIEKERLQEFNQLDLAKQKQLANYSHLLRGKNLKGWLQWMNEPVNQQLLTMGGTPFD